MVVQHDSCFINTLTRVEMVTRYNPGSCRLISFVTGFDMMDENRSLRNYVGNTVLLRNMDRYPADHSDGGPKL
jgi:hypothetical protein